MGFDPTLIAPYKSGLSKYYKPFLIGNDAFIDLENCYSWRGNIIKREGSSVLARVAKWATSTGITSTSPPIVTTAAPHGLLTGDMVYLENVKPANATVTTITASVNFGDPTIVITSGAHGLSPGITIIISGSVGISTKDKTTTFNDVPWLLIAVPAANQLTLSVETEGTYVSGGVVLLGGLEKQAFAITVLSPTTFSLQTLTSLPPVGALAAGVAVSADIYLPIVGTRTFIVTSTGNEQLIVFTPKRAYLFNTTTFVLDNISFNSAGSPILWAGTKDNFFYSSNYFRVMWATNNISNTADQPVGIRYFDGSSTQGWRDFQPLVSGSTTFLNSALIILPYRGRLVVLNTTEGSSAVPPNQANAVFYNRARWSQVGTPFAGTTNFGLAGSATITNVSIGAAPAIITTSLPHGFTTGQLVGITNISGSVGTLLNGNKYTITVTGPTTFTIPVDTTGKVYTSGGVAQLLTSPSTASPDINAWRDDIPGKGGFIDADTSERIVSAEIINDTLIVGFQFSTWRLRYTGQEILPFLWERISTNFGSEGTFSTINFDDKVSFISRRGIIASTFNDVARIDLQIPDQVDEIETGAIGEGLNRVHGIRDFQKRLAYWIYGTQANNSQTPNQVLCFNYEDNTWSTFNQSFTCLGYYKMVTDNIWATWTTIWDGDTSTWNSPLDQENTIMVVAGDVSSRVWHLMDPDVSQDDGKNYNISITTNLINPYFNQGKRCKLAYYDLYLTATGQGQITLENFINDDDSKSWLTKTVDTNDNAVSENPTRDSKYIRVFLGMIAKFHQIRLTLSPSQLIDVNIGGSDFELQGIIFHTRMQGRIKE